MLRYIFVIIVFSETCDTISYSSYKWPCHNFCNVFIFLTNNNQLLSSFFFSLLFFMKKKFRGRLVTLTTNTRTYSQPQAGRTYAWQNCHLPPIWIYVENYRLCTNKNYWQRNWRSQPPILFVTKWRRISQCYPCIYMVSKTKFKNLPRQLYDFFCHWSNGTQVVVARVKTKAHYAP